MPTYEANSKGGHDRQNARSGVKNLGSSRKVLSRGTNMYMRYENPITYHSKDMANAKVLADKQTYKDRKTNKHTDRWTGHKLYAPDLLIWGYKK
jgi:hypothetical protein